MKRFKKGYIHSIDTMGLVDGPNIRVVVFMQGCDLRCMFCHNPDTWKRKSKHILKSIEVVDQVRKYRPYIEQGGGVTFSGGEPLFQSKFLLEMLKLCKDAGISTCLDTSGTGYDKKYLDDILKYTDLVILDIKAIDPNKYKEVTGRSINQFNHFKEKVKEHQNKLWLRQVIVPGFNDSMEYINELKEYVKEFDNVETVDLLPYHTMGITKYEELKIPYRLKGVKDMDKEKCEELEKIVNEEI